MDVLEDKENFLTNRKEIKIIVKAEKNPSYKEVLNIISEEFKIGVENIIIKQVKGKFGRNTFLISAFIYKTKEDKEKFEPKSKKKEEAVEKKAEEKPAEEKKEMPKQETQEVKEEKPEETKTE